MQCLHVSNKTGASKILLTFLNFNNVLVKMKKGIITNKISLLKYKNIELFYTFDKKHAIDIKND